MDPSPEALASFFAREPAAVRDLIAQLAPVIHVRVGRALMRRASARAQRRDPGEEVRDLTQEVFAYLFAEDAKVLRAWRPSRGMSLANFVGMVAEHQVADIFRSGRKRPWSDALDSEAELDSFAAKGAGPEGNVASREYYTLLLDRVRAELTPRGYTIFQMLFVEELPVDDVVAATGMTPDAVYAWRSRLPKIVRKIAAELDAEETLSEIGQPARTP